MCIWTFWAFLKRKHQKYFVLGLKKIIGGEHLVPQTATWKTLNYTVESNVFTACDTQTVLLFL